MSSPKCRTSSRRAAPKPVTTGHKRARPRKKPQSPSPPPAATKRRKHDTPQADFFAIKDIIDEKFIGGKRHYKIDWEDNSSTGASFEPTWEPEENVTEDAVEDWEREKQRRVLLGRAGPRTTQDQALDPSGGDSPSGGIYVELPSKADFLRSRPDFDAADVLAISSSQLSQFPHPDSESDLPPTQFLVISSQPSDDNFLPDSQPDTVGFDQSRHSAIVVKAAAGFSQKTTIPDSQDFFTDCSQDPVQVPWTSEQLEQGEVSPPKASPKPSSGTSIPSRQPDSNQVSFEHFSISINPDPHPPSQKHLSGPSAPPAADWQASIRPPSSRATFGFLTQPEFDTGEFSLSVKSRSQSQPQVATKASESQVPAASAHESPQDDSHQPAQRVSPLPNETSHFLTQRDAEFFSASEDYEFVPDTSQRNSGQSEQHQIGLPQQPVVHNTCELTAVLHQRSIIENHQTEHRVYQYPIPATPGPESLMMEDSQPAESERSAIDALRAIQMQFIPVQMRESLGFPADTANHSGGEDRVQEEPPTPVSPSDIMSTVEMENMENLEQAQPQAVEEPAASWGQNPGAVLFPGPLDRQQNSARAMESNMVSMETTTPASGAIGPAADVDMAFSAAALNRGLEPGAENNDNMLATISPSALLAATGSDVLLEASLREDPGLLAAVDLAEEPKAPDTMVLEEHKYGTLALEDFAANEYIVALPPPARARTETLDILKSHRQEIQAFKSIFSRDVPPSLDSKATVKIDALLQTLRDRSNLPPYHKDFSDLSQEGWTRYARDTTSKIAFIYELLNGLRDVSVEIVILAAGGPIMEKVEAIVNQGGFTHRHVQQQDWLQSSADQGSPCRVVLVDTSQAGRPPRLTENIVIAYDESAEASGLLQAFKTDQIEDQVPLIFSLVEVFSIEHINRRLSPTMDPLEKRLAQVLCLERLAQHADEVAGLEEAAEPHEIANDLVQHMANETGFHAPPMRWHTWDHQQVPEYIFDYYRHSRHQLLADGSRKRAREGSGEDVEKIKRARVDSPPEDVQPSEGLVARFGNNIRVDGGMAQVPLEKLEDLIGLVKDLQSGLDKKGEELKSYIQTIRKFQPKYYNAIGDRGNFEVQRNQAVREKERTQKELERSESKVTKLTEDKKELVAQLQELTKSDKPDLAAAAQRELDLRTAQETAAGTVRQLNSIRKDLSFAQSRYQDASDKAAALGTENADLRLQIRDLETRANANIVEIRRINAARGDSKLRKMYEQEREMRLDREREIERRSEEMRQYKARFGGRETRGSSVPRSPRIRQMSSRNTSPVGDNGGPGGGGGNGNGGGLGVGGGLFGPRGAHLREL